MKTKKIFVSAILILALAIGVSACTAADDEEISPAESASSAEVRPEGGRPGAEGEVPEAGQEPPDNAERPTPPESEGEGQAPEGQQSGMIEPDFAAAAEELGVSEEELREAFGDPGESAPDFAAIAAELGVTEEALMEVLGQSSGGQPGGGGEQP